MHSLGVLKRTCRPARQTHLHHPQLLQPPLYQLLRLPLPKVPIVVLPERVPRPPPGVLAEVVGGELGGLAEEGAEL